MDPGTFAQKIVDSRGLSRRMSPSNHTPELATVGFLRYTAFFGR